jgi:Raf kinase inhibitor-like YbhB/YbcL family protein
MNTNIQFKHVRRWLAAAAAALLGLTGVGSSSAGNPQLMTLTSATFTNGGTLPGVMIFTSRLTNGRNACMANGAGGGNESPQLSWQNAPAETRSFVVIAYDITAQFTHWMMYNIPASTTSLPQGAGHPGSIYGMQNGNDFGQPNYDGPCPPTFMTPHSHAYQFTVYALDTMLPAVQTFGEFVPAFPEGLYHTLIDASRAGHVLSSATITGHFSAVAGD